MQQYDYLDRDRERLTEHSAGAGRWAASAQQAWLMVRINEGDAGDRHRRGELAQMAEGLYLLRADEAQVVRLNWQK